MAAVLTASTNARLRKRDLRRFREILERQRGELLDGAKKVLGGEVHLDPDDFPDEIDAASSEAGLALIGRLRERQYGLISKIASALARLDNGTFGECEECGEEVGIKRLEAHPFANLCIDCKAQQERLERRCAG